MFRLRLLFLWLFIAGTVDSRFEEMFRWKQITYEFLENDRNDRLMFPDSGSAADNGITEQEASSNFIQYNNIPMGVTHYHDKIFITVPRRRAGIPSTLNYIRKKSPLRSGPSLKSYPNLETNQFEVGNTDRDQLVSVYRLRVDECDRLWFVDTGVLEYPGNRTVIQRPSIWIIDLATNMKIRRYEIPEQNVDRSEGMASITVDSTADKCDEAFAYIPDLLNSFLHVYSFQKNRMWRFSNNYFHFDPLRGRFNVVGLQYIWDDGIFSITLGNRNAAGYRLAYFHPMVSISEFSVSTQILQDENAPNVNTPTDDFQHIGQRDDQGQSAMHAFDKDTETIIYSQVGKNGVSCWNTQKPLSPDTHATIAQDDTRMIYPGDLNIDSDGVIWVMTNSMPKFIYGTIDPDVYNFRVWGQSVRDAIKGTVCDTASPDEVPGYGR